MTVQFEYGTHKNLIRISNVDYINELTFAYHFIFKSGDDIFIDKTAIRKLEIMPDA